MIPILSLKTPEKSLPLFIKTLDEKSENVLFMSRLLKIGLNYSIYKPNHFQDLFYLNFFFIKSGFTPTIETYSM